jgi:Derlin-2/3
MFFLVNYSRMLEKGLFHGRGADMLYMMLLSATLLVVCRVRRRTGRPPQGWRHEYHSVSTWHAPSPQLVAPLLNSAQLFLGSSLTFTLVYIWSQNNVHVNMSFLGLVTFRCVAAVPRRSVFLYIEYAANPRSRPPQRAVSPLGSPGLGPCLWQ